MADAVDTIVLRQGRNKHIVRLLNISDGTGEAAVVKVDISTLTGPDGTPPTKTVIEEIEWSIQGFTSVRLLWDHTTDDEIAALAAGNGYKNYKNSGGLVDPASAGDTGDILLTTAGAVSGATYDITLVVRLKD
jgi:hypothetical protein